MSGQFKTGIMHSMKPAQGKLTTLKTVLGTLFRRNFQNWFDFTAVSNIRMYRPNADEFIYDQKIGKIPEICEVYMRGEYICDVTMNDTPAQALTKINDGLIEKITEQKFIEARKKEGGKS